MRYKGQITLVEVKSTTGNIKSAKTILKNKNIYHVNSAIKLGKYNIGREDETLTLPLYMSFLLTSCSRRINPCHSLYTALHMRSMQRFLSWKPGCTYRSMVVDTDEWPRMAETVL